MTLLKFASLVCTLTASTTLLRDNKYDLCFEEVVLYYSLNLEYHVISLSISAACLGIMAKMGVIRRDGRKH